MQKEGDTQENTVDSPVSDAEISSLNIPPHSIEAERAILGSLLLDNSLWEKAIQVDEVDLYRKDHRLIYHAIEQLEGDGQPFDILTVAEWLENHQQLDDAGGPGYLAGLTESIADAGNVKAYAEIVHKRSILRKLIQASHKINEIVFNPKGQSYEQILEMAEQIIFEISEKESRSHIAYRQIGGLLKKALARIQEIANSGSHITGLSTGFDDLDNKTTGLQPADLIIIAGRPSMGKTSLAINMAEHAVIKSQKSVAIFSMEMPSLSLAMRMISSLSRIDQQRVRTGKINDDDSVRLTSSLGMMEKSKLFIDDTPALTPLEIRSRCRRIYREHGLDMVIIDYLQLMQASENSTNRGTENRATEISNISRSLKAMAKELNIPVIALSQLNRSVETRMNKRPIMSDLRESGAIEQDADLILFIYRAEVYDENTDKKGETELIIGKQRNGPIGTVKLTFLGQYTRFENYISANDPKMSH